MCTAATCSWRRRAATFPAAALLGGRSRTWSRRSAAPFSLAPSRRIASRGTGLVPCTSGRGARRRRIPMSGPHRHAPYRFGSDRESSSERSPLPEHSLLLIYAARVTFVGRECRHVSIFASNAWRRTVAGRPVAHTNWISFFHFFEKCVTSGRRTPFSFNKLHARSPPMHSAVPRDPMRDPAHPPCVPACLT